MPSLRDRSFDATAWKRLAFAAVVLVTIGLIIWASTVLHHHYVEVPRLLSQRFSEPLGRPGMITTQIARISESAIPVLIDDLATGTTAQRAKAVELLSTIDDPRILPAIGSAMGDRDVSVRLAAAAGLGRIGKTTAAAYLWPHIDAADDLLRQRVAIGLGLVGGTEDVEKLIAGLKDRHGLDRYLCAWAAGHAIRRLAIKEKYKGVPAARPAQTDEELESQEKELYAIHASLDRLEDVRRNAQRLSELTSVAYSTWDYGHQMAFQVLAVRGPRAFRAPQPIEVVPRPAARNPTGWRGGPNGPAALPTSRPRVGPGDPPAEP